MKKRSFTRACRYRCQTRRFARARKWYKNNRNRQIRRSRIGEEDIAVKRTSAWNIF